MPGFFAKEKERNILIVDVGSGSVGIALAGLRHGAAPILKFASRQELALQLSVNSKRLTYLTFRALKALIADYQKSGRVHPAEIHCYISPHLAVSQTRIIREKFNEPKTLNQSYIDELVKSELIRFEIEHFGKYSDRAVVVESKIMSIRLNGYPVTRVDKTLVNEVEVSVYFTLISSKLSSELTHTIADSFHHSNLSIHSFEFANFALLRDVFKKNRDFIFMDIGSEITSVSIVRNEVLDYSSFFPGGKNTIVRGLLSAAGGQREVVDSLLRTYSEGGITNDHNNSLPSLLGVAGAKWTEQFSESLKGASQLQRLPQNFFLFADRDVSQIFSKYLSSVKLGPISALNHEPTINIVSDDDVREYYDNQSGIASDIFLVFCTIFSNRMFENQ